MVVKEPPSSIEGLRIGPSLRRAWVGYQLRLDEALAAAGFGDRGFPDGRVLRICAVRRVTIADIGRELGITRQGAAKIVTRLHDRRFVKLSPSAEDGRQKVVELAPRGDEFLAVQRAAARRIEADLQREVGPDAFEALARLVAALDAEDAPRLSDYLRAKVMTPAERTSNEGHRVQISGTGGSRRTR